MKKHDMVPDHSFFEAMSSCLVAILPDKFYNKVEEGSIVLKKAKNFIFCKEGVIVEGESSPIKSDVVIFATGYRGDQKMREIFTSPMFRDIVAGSPSSNIVPHFRSKYEYTIPPLHVHTHEMTIDGYFDQCTRRQCVHPRIPRLAIIGYSVNVSNLFIFELRSKWLAHFLHGSFRLPSIKSMEEDINEWEKYMKRYAPNNIHRCCILLVNVLHNDQLCKDMGIEHRRKKGFLADWLHPYGPADYAGINLHQ